ncbi:uncharacterized protein LOC131637067 [Vicia villosa]|uniref:uncharacterized protein LOC131637067 n=1 Tax=Vicia villosa TaxID=3911 RepID=UPI00273BB963|nr:uncharacterized protein LOC131637067 [Vicia villosa]
MDCRPSFSWIMNRILKKRDEYNQVIVGLQDDKFKSKEAYLAIKNVEPTVPWCKLTWNNLARPRAQFTLWLACHDRLATKERLHRFHLIDSPICAFYNTVETSHHLFFECPSTGLMCFLDDFLVFRKLGFWAKEVIFVAAGSC